MNNLSEERLGRAYVRANQFQWDEEVFGPPPPGFDDLPEFGVPECKQKYIRPKMAALERILGTAGTSKAWWLYYLNETEENWSKWYFDPTMEHYFLGRYHEYIQSSVDDLIKETNIK